MSRFDPRDVAVWQGEKMGKATLWRSERLMLGVNAFEPGQSHAPHSHEGQDKVYVVIEGRGAFSLAGQEHELGPGDVLVAPAGVEHGVENRSGARLLVLATLCPPPASKPR
jgi:quercetin dioxygenase-like cupin family protein